MNQNQPTQPQNPNTPPPPTITPQQQSKKVSFWKSKDPAIVIARIVLYIFVGIPLLGIILAILSAILSASYRR